MRLEKLLGGEFVSRCACCCVQRTSQGDGWPVSAGLFASLAPGLAQAMPRTPEEILPGPPGQAASGKKSAYAIRCVAPR